MSKKPVTQTQTADNGTGSSTAKDGFVSPTKCVKLKHLFSQPTTTIEIKNRYDKLHNEQQNESDMDMETTENTEDLIRNKAIPTLNKKAGNTKPPPIVIKGKLHSHKLFLSEIKKVTKKEITLKYAKNSVILYTEDKMDHQTILRQLKEEQTEFHTYTTPEEKTHAFVLRGLDGEIAEEEIKQELQDEHNMQVFHIYKMKNTVRPLYLIITDTKQTASKLNQEIRSIMSVRVSWENRRNQKPIIQCQRCQTWGHSRQNCMRKVKCSRCAEEHEIIHCPNRDFEPKCANCGGKHRSISTTCPVYEYRTSKLPQKKLKEAPLPANPAWRSKQPPHLTQPPPQRQPPPRQRHEDYDSNFPDTLSARDGRSNARPAADRGTSGMTQVRDLNDAFKELNTLINLNEALKAVKHFSSLLREGGKTSRDKFEIMTHFFNEILPSYEI